MAGYRPNYVVPATDFSQPITHETAVRALTAGKASAPTDDPMVAEMRANRTVSQKLMRRMGSGARSQPDVSLASERPRDPMFYWKNNNFPYDVNSVGELQKIRDFCNTPDAPIWMGDYSFKPLGEVQVGDEVIGWTYTAGPKGEQRKKLTRTKVLATNRRIAPEVVKVTFESGREVRCTPDHKWANPLHSPGDTYVPPGRTVKWRQPEYREAKVGQDLVFVIAPTPPLTNEKDRLVAAWLSGIYDGEGCGSGIGQSAEANPIVCRRIKESLDHLGLAWTQDYHSFYLRVVGRHGGAGAQQDLVNFLNWTEPARKITKQNDALILTRPGGGRDRVVSIESLGDGEVVSMQTETGNYIAWGFASSNCRLLYQTHPIIGSAVDIYSKFPLQGIELQCKDDKLTEFYTAHFLDDDQLNYQEFLIDIGREYWTCGEAWPFATFNELLGVWEHEELLRPEDITVIKSPFLREPRFEMRLPETLLQILNEREPRAEYQRLVRDYPELQQFMSSESKLPVSNVLLKQIMFKGDTFHPRGIPIWMRAFRTIIQEEMLNSAQDAIADRLYTPLLLARLGASATDMGTQQPWIPGPNDLMDFEDSLDAALSGDFRVMVHNFAVQLDSVFGRENMPDFSGDFDRIDNRILQTVGLSKTMLSGADQGETYAADALNRDLITQLLTTYQRKLIRHYRQRALIVAEAREHFDYDEHGGKKTVKMEEMLVVDPVSGNQSIVEKPKLLVPDLSFQSMNMQSDTLFRQLIEELRSSGVPISIKSRLVNIPFDLDDEIERSKDEQVRLALAQQETRKEQYKALKDAGLPIPDDLRADFEGKAQVAPAAPGVDPAANGAAAPQTIDPETGEPLTPTFGNAPGTDITALSPPTWPALSDDRDSALRDEGDTPETDNSSDEDASVTRLPRNVMRQRYRPPESDEQRAGMPRASALEDESGVRRVGGLGGPIGVGQRSLAGVDPDTLEVLPRPDIHTQVFPPPEPEVFAVVTD